ncbi:hypothetical protein FRC00_005710 [Tulasnella sp. 408]|nr:hypothetical protein FRC00_005710 [Tulasnella sp. 408]
MANLSHMEVRSALAKTPPIQPTSGPAQVSRVPSAKAVPEIYVQPVKSYHPKTPDPHAKPLSGAQAPRRQSGHARHASHPVEEQSQEGYDGLPSYDSGSHPSRRPSSQNSRRASLSRGTAQRRQTTTPTLGYEPDYVIAMHDFSPELENATGLRLRAGEVIRVLNRSTTGWWDGELDGRRGWFPSNYTSGEATTSVAAGELASFRMVTVPDASQERQAALSRDQAPSRSGSRASSTRPWQWKLVIGELSALLAQARAASEKGLAAQGAVDARGRREPLGPELHRELQDVVLRGDTVYDHVKKFLAIAVECGIELPPDELFPPAPSLVHDPYTTSSATSPKSDLRNSRSVEIRAEANIGSSVTQRRARSQDEPQLFKSPSPEAGSRIHEGGTQRRNSEGGAQRRLRSNRGAATDQELVYRSRARATPSPYRKPKYSIRSASSLYSHDSSLEEYESQDSDSDSDPDSYFPSEECTSSQALAISRTTHDRLLSVIAAFMGHIHSHSRLSHASSKGHLIELTRRTVNQVHSLLTLVGAVREHQGICEAKPREVCILKQAHETLYNFTKEIVEAVKDMLANDPVVSEDEEKKRALQAATGTLRAGGECITAVNMCLSTKMGEEEFVINIAIVQSGRTATPI